jgi:hypothetical protein
MIAFRSHALHAGEVDLEPDVASVHVFPEEIDTTQVEVNRVGCLLHLHASKKNHRNAPFAVAANPVPYAEISRKLRKSVAAPKIFT